MCVLQLDKVSKKVNNLHQEAAILRRHVFTVA